MNAAEMLKKNSENSWARIFVTYINSEYGFDYEVQTQSSESSPVDVLAVSKEDKHKTLLLQLTYVVETPFTVHSTAQSDPGFTEDPAKQAIERKRLKFTAQGLNMENIILILQGYMDSATAARVFSDPGFEKYKQYSFQGIYYVSPPMISGETDEVVQDAVIYPIKNAFAKS